MKKLKNLNKNGRPQLTVEDCMPKGWENIIIKKSFLGWSEVEIRAHLCMLGGRFSHGTWHTLQKRDEKFLETIKKGKLLCQAWWERVGRKKLNSKNFQTGLWSMNMKNRFGWSDKIMQIGGDHDDKDYRDAFFGYNGNGNANNGGNGKVITDKRI